VSPAGVGIAGIEVTNADGSVVAGIFIYTPDVADVVFLSPSSGSTQGGTDVTLTGTGFLSVSQVTFGGTPATQFTIISDNEVVARVANAATPIAAKLARRRRSTALPLLSVEAGPS
jgi:hypothetical protein